MINLHRMEEEIRRMIRMAGGTISDAIDGRAPAVYAILENAADQTAFALGCIVTEAARASMEFGVVDQVGHDRSTRGIVTDFASAVVGSKHLTTVIPGFQVIKVGFIGVAGGTGVGMAKSRVLIGVPKGAAGFRTHGDRSNGTKMAGEATVVNLGVVGVNCENGAVAVGNAGRGPTRDKLTVIRGVIYQAVGMAVFTGNHRPSARLGGLGLEDGVGDRTINWVDANDCVIGPG